MILYADSSAVLSWLLDESSQERVLEELAALHVLDEASESWHVLEVSEDVVARARAGFPVEPVRSLDAIHLASAWSILDAAGEVTTLSLDDRVRSNARAMGMRVVPD